MTPLLAVTLWVVLFAGASLLADTLPRRLRPLPPLLLGVLAFFVLLELTRCDHGYEDAYWTLAFLVAPIVLIFGGAAFGTRRFYGWPDLGPHPSRAAFLALCMLLGVLIGKQVRADDVAVSVARAETIRTGLLAWRKAHDGRWPERIEDAVPDLPRTRMGWIAPPAFAFGRDDTGAPVLAIPLGRHGWWTLRVQAGTWAHRRAPPGAPAPATPRTGS